MKGKSASVIDDDIHEKNQADFFDLFFKAALNEFTNKSKFETNQDVSPLSKSSSDRRPTIEAVIDSIYYYGKNHGNQLSRILIPAPPAVEPIIVAPSNNMVKSTKGKIKINKSSAAPAIGGHLLRKFGSKPKKSKTFRGCMKARSQISFTEPDLVHKNSSEDKIFNIACDVTPPSQNSTTGSILPHNNNLFNVGNMNTKKSGAEANDSLICRNRFTSTAVICGRTITIGHYETTKEAAEASDRAMIRALGPIHCAEHNLLGNHISYYSRDPLENFTAFDSALKRELFGSNWLGPKPCDFSFLVTSIPHMTDAADDLYFH